MSLADSIECIEEADMRRNEFWCTSDVAQPLTKFTQHRTVFDLNEDSANGVITAPVTAVFATFSGKRPHFLTYVATASSTTASSGTLHTVRCGRKATVCCCAAKRSI